MMKQWADCVFVLQCTVVYTVHSWVHHLFLDALLSLCIMDFLKNPRPAPLVNDHVLGVTSSSSCFFLAVSSLSALSWKASWASLSRSSHSSWRRSLQRENNKILDTAEPPRLSMWAFITGHKDCWVAQPLLARSVAFTDIFFILFLLLFLLRPMKLSIFNR